MTRCINYSFARPNKICRRKIFEEGKYFCDHHKPINFDDIQEQGCIICGLENIDIKDMKVLYCNHIWHKPCIKKWFETKEMCPLCRNVL